MLLCEAGNWTQWSIWVLSNLECSVILWLVSLGMCPWFEQGSEELCEPNAGGCVSFSKRQGDASSHTMLLAMPHTGQAVFSCLQAACLSLHPSPSTTVQTTAFSSKKCPKYHYGQMFIQWSPQEILMLNHCPVFASKYNNLSILMSPIERDFNQNDSQGLMNIQQYLQGWSKSFSVYCSNVIVLLPYKHIY